MRVVLAGRAEITIKASGRTRYFVGVPTGVPDSDISWKPDALSAATTASSVCRYARVVLLGPGKSSPNDLSAR